MTGHLTFPIALIPAVVLYDLLQTRHAVLRDFPVIGHFRFWLEAIGPELRQCIVTSNDEELPFSRDQRRWVYASAKLQNNYSGFGTDSELGEGDDTPSDHAALPLRTGISRVHGIFAEHGVHHSVTWIASGKLGLPESALMAFCLVADMIKVAREATLSIGCISAQRCHTGHCPTGVATQNRRLVRGFDPHPRVRAIRQLRRHAMEDPRRILRQQVSA